jgi:hypothetical protein
VFAILIDDNNTAPGANDATQFGGGALDIDGVFERFRGVGSVERRVAKWKFEQRTRASGQIARRGTEHRLRQIECQYGRAWTSVPNVTREAALARTEVEHAIRLAHGRDNRLDMQDARVDRRWEMLFVGGVAFERPLDFA